MNEVKSDIAVTEAFSVEVAVSTVKVLPDCHRLQITQRVPGLEQYGSTLELFLTKEQLNNISGVISSYINLNG